MARDDITVEPVPEDLPGIRGYLSRFRQDFDAHNHDGTNSKRFLTLIAETLAARALTIRKRSFTDNTSGMWAGLVDNVMKLYVGTASAYLKWTGTALQIAGDIVAGSLTIGNNASINSSGYATFISMSSLNKKAVTNFENSARFINTTTTGTTIAPVYGNQGVTIGTTATAERFSRVLWDIANIMTNNPTFVCTMKLSAVGAGSRNVFIGLGQPTVTGAAAHVFTSLNVIGFRFTNVGSSTLGIAGVSNNGDASSASFTSQITTMVVNDIVELFIKVDNESASPSATFYVRKNGGSLTNGGTLTTKIPNAAGENIIQFSVTNENTAAETAIIVQGASYEH